MRAVKKKGLGAVALTDHNTIGAFSALSRKEKGLVICGEEINTDKGEVIALFLEERIAPGPLDEVLDAIKDQGAYSLIPHPFDRLRRKRMRLDGMERKEIGSVLKRINAIEAYNSRIMYWKEDTQKAITFAKEHKKPITGGSDAHFAGEVGASFIEVSEFSNLEELRNLIFNGRFTANGKPNSILYHVGTRMVKFRNRFIDPKLK